MSWQYPPDWMLHAYLPYYRYLIERVIWAIEPFPEAVISSWFRDQSSNASVGGHPFSQHRLAFAMDLVVPERKAELADRLRRTGLITLVEGSHIHTQIFLAGTLPQNLFVI